MLVKDKFTLLQGIPNSLDLSQNVINTHIVKNSFEKTKTILEMIEDRIEHYTKKKVYGLLSTKNSFNIISLQEYPLPVTYNKPTKNIIINLSYFGVNDITPTNPNPRDLYACLVYGYCLSKLVTKKYEISIKYYNVVSSYLLSLFIRVYGKDYGMLGYYSSQIPKLKFLINCYILTTFFGVSNKEEVYKMAGTGISYRYRDQITLLNNSDFSDITGFIKALSDLEVMPGLNKYHFTAKILKYLSINFIPALEDCSRFFAIMTTTDSPGLTFLPSFLYRYNEEEYDKILKISNMVFK